MYGIALIIIHELSNTRIVQIFDVDKLVLREKCDEENIEKIVALTNQSISSLYSLIKNSAIYYCVHIHSYSCLAK